MCRTETGNDSKEKLVNCLHAEDTIVAKLGRAVALGTLCGIIPAVV